MSEFHLTLQHSEAISFFFMITFANFLQNLAKNSFRLILW